MADKDPILAELNKMQETLSDLTAKLHKGEITPDEANKIIEQYGKTLTNLKAKMKELPTTGRGLPLPHKGHNR